MRIELMTSSLPRMRSTTELREHILIFQKKFGAGDETRTRDIQLGRLTLYQLSYSRNGFRICDCGLRILIKSQIRHLQSQIEMVHGVGFEPT